MLNAISLSVALLQSAAIHVGWSDEMNHPENWKPLGVANQAKVTSPTRGAIRLTLGAVPSDWPYTYQWSGVTQEAKVNVALFPILMARVPRLQGYAHLDIDVLDTKDNVIKGLRASTLTEAGLTTINLRESLDPAIYHLRIRLIVGGKNEGCSADYSWIRLVRSEDAVFLKAHPDFQDIIHDFAIK